MKNQRLYSCFERERGTRIWRNVGKVALPLDQARRVYQEKLLAPFLGYCSPNVQRELRIVVTHRARA